MRAAFRLLASAGNTLTPLIPTGLTGIITHPSPRPHLIHLYKSTLKALAALPESSVYRQSVEALTKQRLAVVESQVPAGYDEWKSRIARELEQNKSEFSLQDIVDGAKWSNEARAMDQYGYVDERDVEFDGDDFDERHEGPQSDADLAGRDQAKEFGRDVTHDELLGRTYYPGDEPAISTQQVSDIESKIGAGLIEEILIVAKRELKLVETMKEYAVWEALAEKPVEGQWAYAARDRHTAAAGQSADYSV